MNLELISALIFYAILGLIIYKNRKKMEILDKVFFVYKWKKGVEYIKKMARPEWLWKILSTISIPICLFFMVFAVQTMITSAISILESPDPSPTVTLLIPGVQLPGSDFYVPFWYGIISIIILAVVHEASHGIIAIVEKIKLKTTGTGLFLFLPLAFVEAEPKSFLKSKRLSRIRMLCAGSFANLTVAFLAFLLVVYVITPIAEDQIMLTNVLINATSDGPAMNASIPNNSIVLGLNNESISNITDFYYKILELEPNQSVNLTTDSGVYNFITGSHPENNSLPYLGVQPYQDWEYKEELQNYPSFLLEIPIILMQLFMWISNLNLAVGVFNLLPLWITDGGKILVDILSIIVKNDKLLIKIINFIFFLVLSLLLFNMFGPFLLDVLTLI